MRVFLHLNTYISIFRIFGEVQLTFEHHDRRIEFPMQIKIPRWLNTK